jgi:hypothetical protein
MPKGNDLEGRQDMGGKHGGQAGMPKAGGRVQHTAGHCKGREGARAARGQSEGSARQPKG